MSSLGITRADTGINSTDRYRPIVLTGTWAGPWCLPRGLKFPQRFRTLATVASGIWGPHRPFWRSALTLDTLSAPGPGGPSPDHNRPSAAGSGGSSPASRGHQAGRREAPGRATLPPSPPSPRGPKRPPPTGHRQGPDNDPRAAGAAPGPGRVRTGSPDPPKGAQGFAVGNLPRLSTAKAKRPWGGGSGLVDLGSASPALGASISSAAAPDRALILKRIWRRRGYPGAGPRAHRASRAQRGWASLDRPQVRGIVAEVAGFAALGFEGC